MAKRRLIEPVKSHFSPRTAGTFRMYQKAQSEGEQRAPGQVRGPVKAGFMRQALRLRLRAIKQSFSGQR